MGAQLRVLRRRTKSVESTQKITRAQELIAASRIVKAQARVNASRPYAQALLRALESAASNAAIDHPLTTPAEDPKRAAVLLITSDRGFAGAFSANVIRECRALLAKLEERGLEVDLYCVGKKGISFFAFRGYELAGQWEGFTEEPTYAEAKEVAKPIVEALTEDEGHVDEYYVITTQFQSMVTQIPFVRRLIPVEVQVEEVGVGEDEEVAEAGAGGAAPTEFPLYEFEPSPEGVLDTLMPRYVEYAVFFTLLHSAASQHAARQRAMKSATDNAADLIKDLTRQANQARQSEITQEISEIVGGADALAESKN
jgi:F-type H+-transporting ATPase subunit gamma